VNKGSRTKGRKEEKRPDKIRAQKNRRGCKEKGTLIEFAFKVGEEGKTRRQRNCRNKMQV